MCVFNQMHIVLNRCSQMCAFALSCFLHTIWTVVHEDETHCNLPVLLELNCILYAMRKIEEIPHTYSA